MKHKVDLLVFFHLIAGAVCAQNTVADKQILEIESFRKYDVFKIDRKEDLATLSDSTTEVLEVINYSTKGKKPFSKLTEKAKTKFGESKKTYYFYRESDIFAPDKIFAIIDSVQDANNNRKILKYYFKSGELSQVLNEKNIDVTSSIDKEELYFFLVRRFDKSVLRRW